MNAEEKILYDRLLNKAFITRNARFEAVRRLRRRRISSNVSLALLSLSVIVFNILQLSSDFAQYTEQITVVTIVFSTLILSITLLVSGMSYPEREVKFHECALNLSNFIDDLRCKEKYLSLQGIQTAYKEYHRIIDTCPYNHSPYDYYRAVVMEEIEKKKKEQAAGKEGENVESCDGKWSWLSKSWRWIKRELWRWTVWVIWHVCDVSTLYWLLAIVLPIAADWLIFCVDWKTGTPINNKYEIINLLKEFLDQLRKTICG